MKKLLFALSALSLMIACNKDYTKIDEAKISEYLTAKNIKTEVTASGVHYVIEKEGNGAKPTATDEIAVKYKGYFLDDKVFDQSDSVVLNLNSVIAGWTDGLQQFKEGSTGKLFIPSELAYGDQKITDPSTGVTAIPKNAVLGFDVTLLAINPISKKNKAEIEAFIAKKGWKAQSTASGLYYVIDEPGTGENPSTSANVTINYKGYLTSEKVFDQNPSATFKLANLIEGWREGIPLFKKGGKGKLLIPSKLGYYDREKAAIPAYSVLVFEIELIDFQ